MEGSQNFKKDVFVGEYIYKYFKFADLVSGFPLDPIYFLIRLL